MVFILVTCVIVLVHTKDATTLEYDDLLPVNETNARHRDDTGQGTIILLFFFDTSSLKVLFTF